MIALPAIDVLEGRVVRLAQGDFSRVTDFGDDPVSIAVRYEQAGASELHLVSLDGARTGGADLVAIVREICSVTKLRVQAGGGIRSREMIAAVSEAGAERVVIGSVAISKPVDVQRWLEEYGSGAIVLALDVRMEDGVPVPVLHGWREAAQTDLWTLLDGYIDCGLRHLLCTDVARDGMGTGPNLELYAEILRRYPGIALQASGGIANLDDVSKVRALGAHAVVVGRALLTGAFTPGSLLEACE